MPEISVLNTDGKTCEKLNLDDKVFDGRVNLDLMRQAVNVYLANQRRGLANTKTRGEVSGGGRKPWRQKGTGRARVGSTRSPLWKGGGKLFGPKPHSFSKDLSKKMKTAALKSALNAMFKDQQLMVISDLKLSKVKTKEFVKILKNLKLDETKSCFVLTQADENINLSVRNVSNIAIELAKNLTTYSALSCRRLVLTKQALNEVVGRITKGL